MVYIYMITCIANGKVYIGQTKTPNKRKREHLSALKRNQHHSDLLQRAFNKYGLENFRHDIVCELNDEDADDFECAMIEQYDSCNKHKGFNIESGGNAYKKVSESTKAKLRITSSKNYNYEALQSPEARRKKGMKLKGKGNFAYGKTPRDWMNEETYHNWVEGKRKRMKENNPMKNGHTQDSRKKISESMKGEKNPFYGKHHTDEVKEIIRQCRYNTKGNKRDIICLNNGRIFSTITEACIKYGLDNSSVSKVCRGKINSTKGYQFRYIGS